VQRRSRELGDEIAKLDAELAATESALHAILLDIPNITLEVVPEGGAEKNQVVREWGAPHKAEGVKPHWEIGEALGIIDFQRGAKITGSGFIVFRAAGARTSRDEAGGTAAASEGAADASAPGRQECDRAQHAEANAYAHADAD